MTEFIFYVFTFNFYSIYAFLPPTPTRPFLKNFFFFAIYLNKLCAIVLTEFIFLRFSLESNFCKFKCCISQPTEMKKSFIASDTSDRMRLLSTSFSTSFVHSIRLFFPLHSPSKCLVWGEKSRHVWFDQNFDPFLLTNKL